MKTFQDLFSELRTKVALKDETSGTYAAVQAGPAAAADLMVKAAESAAKAASDGTESQAAEEVALLLYQVQVLMLAKGLTLSDVNEHL